MTTTPQPEAPTPPTLTMETGRLYPVGSINLMTTEIQGLFRKQDDEGAYIDRIRPHFRRPANLPEGLDGPSYLGIVWDADLGIYGFPLEAGTFRTRLQAYWYRPAGEGEDAPALITFRSYANIDLVVTGSPIGTPYDRETLNHYHPRIETILANQSSLKEAVDSLLHRVGTAETKILEIEAQLADDGG